MITRLKISKSATALIAARYREARQHYTPNIMLRNALMFSIANGDSYSNEDIDTAGTEFQIATLLGENTKIFKLLIDQYYQRKLSDQDYKKILVYHLEKGLSHKEFKSVFN